MLSSKDGKHGGDLVAQKKIQRHQPDRFMVHRVFGLHSNRRERRPTRQKSVCRQVGSVFRNRHSDCAEPEIEPAHTHRSRAKKCLRRHSDGLSPNAGGGLFRRTNRDLHGAGSSRTGTLCLAAPRLWLSRCQRSKFARSLTFRDRAGAHRRCARHQEIKGRSGFCAGEFVWQIAIIAHATFEDACVDVVGRARMERAGRPRHGREARRVSEREQTNHSVEPAK